MIRIRGSLDKHGRDATLGRGRARAENAVFNCFNQDVFQPKSSILGERGNKLALASDAEPLQLGECAFDSRHAVGCNHCHCYSIVLLLPIQLVNGFGLFLGVIHSLWEDVLYGGPLTHLGRV